MRVPTLVGVVSVLAWSLPAEAQSDRELATRQELIAQAGGLSEQGKHAEALATAKTAAAIKMTPSLRLFIGGEQSTLGLLADAYGSGRQCAVEAEADARLNNRDRILEDCRALERSLEGRVGRVTVKLPAPARAAAGVHVTISGEEINPALIGEPYVVSPGKLSVVVTAAGSLPFRADLDVAEGGSPVVDVQLLPDPTAQSCREGQERVHGECVPACAVGQVRTSDAAAVCVAVAAPPPAPTSTQRLVAIGAGGVGLAGVVLGSVFGGLAVAKLNQAEAACPTHAGCPGQAITERNTETTYASVSTGAFIVGGALLAAGVTLYLTAPKPVAVGLELTPTRLGLRGSF